MTNSPEKIELTYNRVQKRARRIVSRFPKPSFYKICEKEMRLSALSFETHPIILKIRELVEDEIKGAMGHGRKHAAKVTIDAGALMLVEGSRAGYSDVFLNRRFLLVQCAGMLHDARRREEDHAVKGADHARELLKQFAFFPQEVEDVACAIRNHEAFKQTLDIDTPEGALLSDCLYDADKFRWGADNFSDTVWDMVRHFRTPLAEFVKLFPRGMQMIENIKATFRTATGKAYGPEIIDQGLDIGKEVFRMINTDFSVYL